MNKSDIIAAVAKKSEVTKVKAGEVLDEYLKVLKAVLKKDGKVVIPDLGILTVKQRKARKGRNPATGADIQIKASRVVSFKPGKALKEHIKKAKVFKKGKK